MFAGDENQSDEFVGQLASSMRELGAMSLRAWLVSRREAGVDRDESDTVSQATLSVAGLNQTRG